MKQALDLLERLIADPAAMKAKIGEYIAAKKAHDETLEKVKQAQENAEQMLDDAHRIAVAGKAATEKAAAAQANAARQAAELKERERHFEERHKALSEQEAALAAHAVAFHSDVTSHAAEKAAWEKDVAEREAALDKKTKEVDEAYKKLRAILPG